MDLQTYFAIAVNMRGGEKLAIPCNGPRDQESKRVQLYRIRKTYAEKIDRSVLQFLSIYRSSSGTRDYIVLERKKESAVGEAFIIKEDGSAVPIGDSAIRDTSIERYVQTAILDGLSTEELISMLDSPDLEPVIRAEWNRQIKNTPTEINLPEKKTLFIEETSIIELSDKEER